MDKIKLAQQTISLLSSMIKSGENFTPESLSMVNNAMEGLESMKTFEVTHDLEVIKDELLDKFYWITFCKVEDDIIIVEEDYEIDEDEKNSGDCYDTARENGDEIIELFPMLIIDEYFCHRNKYAIVHLKLRDE